MGSLEDTVAKQCVAEETNSDMHLDAVPVPVPGSDWSEADINQFHAIEIDRILGIDLTMLHESFQEVCQDKPTSLVELIVDFEEGTSA